MAEKLITKSFERLLDKGKHRGFITYEELGKSLGKRNSTQENVEKALNDLVISKRVKVMIIPDIESVNYGRGVGYGIIEHVPPTDIEKISATQIRKDMLNK